MAGGGGSIPWEQSTSVLFKNVPLDCPFHLHGEASFMVSAPTGLRAGREAGSLPPTGLAEEAFSSRFSQIWAAI